MILKQRGFNKPSTEIIGLSAFQNHLFSLIYIISEQGEIAQARIIREDMRQGLGYLKRRFGGGGPPPGETAAVFLLDLSL